MKITKKVYGAESTRSETGTTFYSVTLDELEKIMKSDSVNVWLRAAIDKDGFDAIDLDKNLFGSKVIDDTLYICVTDGHDIEVNGRNVDPEDALGRFSIEDLSEYIKEADDKTVKRYISEYEIYTPDFDELAIKLLRDGESFERLADDYESFR